MDLAFTEYIRAFETDRESAAFEDAWQKIAQVLRRELRLRNLWHVPPRRLGVFEAGTWGDPEVFRELCTDTLIEAVLKPLPSLAALVRAGSAIEGAVVTNARRFVGRRQRLHNPIGFRVYEMLREAVEQEVEAGALYMLQDGGAVGNHTVLAFAADAERHTVARDGELEELLGTLALELHPDLVTATHGRARAELLEDLVECLRGLGRAGIRAFRFKALLEPLRRAAREYWIEGMRNTELAGDPVDGVRCPDGPEEVQAFEQLVDCVGEDLPRLTRRRGTQAHLERLWGFLHIWAAEVDSDPLPSRRQLAVGLGIPRPTLKQLFNLLAPVVEACQQLIRKPLS